MDKNFISYFHLLKNGNFRIFEKSKNYVHSLLVLLFFISTVSVVNGKVKGDNVYLDSDVVGLNVNEFSKSDKNVFQLVSHGKPGYLLINGQWKNAEAIVDYLKPLVSKEISHINIYGCEFGKGEIGNASVSYLEQKLGITVSASDDITGKDGDWELEVGTPVSNVAIKDYAYNLQCNRTYTVYTTYVPDAAYCSAVSYRVSGATNTFVTVNQTVPPAGISYEGKNWTKLATGVAPNSIGDIRVTIAGDSSATVCPNAYVIADAILLVDDLGNSYTVDDAQGKPTGTWGVGGAAGYKTTVSYFQKVAGSTGHYFDWVFADQVQLTDTDYDGIPNVCDLDDDNDGILDTTEGLYCGATNMTDFIGTSFPSSPTKTLPEDGYPAGSTTTLTLSGSTSASATLNNFSVVAGPAFAYRDIATGGDGNGLVLDGNLTNADNFKALFTFSKPIYNLKFKIADIDYGTPNTTSPNSELITINVKLSDGTIIPLDSAKITAYFFKNNNATNGIDSLVPNYKPLGLSGNTIDGAFGFAHQIYKFDYNNCQTLKGIVSLELVWTAKTAASIRFVQTVFDLQYCGGGDTDGDCMPDYLDTDSDNDGCSDAIEGGSVVVTAKNVGAYNNLLGGVDANGVPKLLSPNGQTVGTSTDASKKDPECTPCVSGSVLFTDNDNDGIGDYCDVDDDNDGILDAIECPAISGEFAGTFGIGPVNNALFCRDLQGNKPVGYRYNCGTPAAPSYEATYAVIDNTSAYTWHVNWRNQKGHTTGDAQDAFLAINGALAVGIFYNQEFSLAAGTTYDFGLYAANANNGTTEPTEVGIRLVSPTGAVLQNFKSGTLLNQNEWVKAGGVITPTVSGTYRLEVYNVYTNAAGNDFSIDDIYFNAVGGCPDYDKDGTPDYLDNDSDNDKCPDSIEGAGTFNYSNISASSTRLTGPVYDTGLSKQLPTSTVGQGAGLSVDSTLVDQPCIKPDYKTTGAIKCPTCTTPEPVVCATGDNIPKSQTTGYKMCPPSQDLSTQLKVNGPDANGCVTFTGFDIKKITPIETCVIALGPNGLMDTTYIKIPIDEKALPLTLIQFKGYSSEDGIQLYWHTTKEVNFDKFIVEKRILNDNEYSALAEIKGGLNSYSYFDKNPNLGVNYYRLKMVDKDGSYQYSNPISVQNSGENNYIIYPNPVTGNSFKLKNTFELASYQLINANGIEIPLKYTKTNVDHVFTITGSVQTGTHIFNYETKEGQSISKKIQILNE